MPEQAPEETPRRRRPTVLLVDDEPALAKVLSALLREHAKVVAVSSAERALEQLGKMRFDVAFFDVDLGCGMDGIALIGAARKIQPELEVIICSVDRSVPTVVRAIRAGALDYTTKDFDALQSLNLLLERALDRQRERRELAELRAVAGRGEAGFVGGRDEPMKSVLATVSAAAISRSTVLLLGESGTGKEVIARRIHGQSPRARERFVGVNVAAVPSDLLESTLFGHEKGSFTGAQQRLIGKFEEADGGTLFLDEVGELARGLQVKLLRAIQERQVDRVGGSTPVAVDVRIIAATNRDLSAAVARGDFREDLYYRLNVVPIHLPPLRARLSELPDLLEALAKKHAAHLGRVPLSFSPEAIGALSAHQWPGNVRELENLIERLVVLTTKPVIEVGDLPAEYRLAEFAAAAEQGAQVGGLDAAVDAFEKSLIQRALREHGGSHIRTARALGIPVSTLSYRLAKYGLSGSAP